MKRKEISKKFWGEQTPLVPEESDLNGGLTKSAG